jgi:hypothetical protein
MTDHTQGAFEAALQADLAAARQQNLVLADQLRAADARNEAQAHRIDFLIQDRERVIQAGVRDERIVIRIGTLAESVATIAIKQLEEIREEIRRAAFGKVPGTAQDVPAPPVGAVEPGKTVEPGRGPPTPIISVEQIAKTFGADFSLEGLGDFIGRVSSASLLPPARLGNGAVPKQ